MTRYETASSESQVRDWLSAAQAQECQLYMQPSGLGGYGPSIAGGWQRFSQIVLLAREDERSKAKTLAVPSVFFDAFDQTQGAKKRFNNIIAKRRDFAGLSMAEPQIMAVLNATPDSFSDGGKHLDPDVAVQAGQDMLRAGAAILDVGGESTRPGADKVSENDEQARVTPIIEGLVKAGCSRVSIDTRNPLTMATAVRAGAAIINDVTALEHRADSLRTAVKLKRPLVLMHMKGQPKTMQNAPLYANVVLDVYDYLSQRVDACVEKGADRSQIAIDPGIGFGKTLAHNLALLSHLSLFHALGCPILLGVSRKSFIGKICPDTPADQRLPGTLAATLAGFQQGVQIHRVHDVEQVIQAREVWQAIHKGA